MIVRRLLRGARQACHPNRLSWQQHTNRTRQRFSNKKQQPSEQSYNPYSVYARKTPYNKQPSEQLAYNHQEYPESQTKEATSSSIRRQLFNDMVQLPLKYAAYKIAGQNNGPFLAELKRSAIDALNHLVLFAINKANLKPTKTYPYGLGKLKSFVCNIPAFLFLASGVETIAESIVTLMGHNPIDQHSNFYSASLYAVSIAVELFVVYRNLSSADLVKREEGESRWQTAKKFFGNLSNMQNPLFQVILYENIVTLTSTLVPLLCEVVHWIFPSLLYVFPTGTILLGGIQIFVGLHLIKANIGDLVGEMSVDSQTSEGLANVVKQSEYVEEVYDIKAVKMGPEIFRSSAQVTINKEHIQRKIREEYAHDIDKIIYEPDAGRRRQLLLELLQELPVQTLDDVSKELDKLQLNSKRKFRQCADSDLDFNIDAKSQQEVERLEESVEKVADMFKMDNYLTNQIKLMLAEDEKKLKGENPPETK